MFSQHLKLARLCEVTPRTMCCQEPLQPALSVFTACLKCLYLFCLLRFACRFCFLRVGDFPSIGLRRDNAMKQRSRTTMRCCRRTTDSVVPAASRTSFCCSLMIDCRHSLRRGSSGTGVVLDVLAKVIKIMRTLMHYNHGD